MASVLVIGPAYLKPELIGPYATDLHRWLKRVVHYSDDNLVLADDTLTGYLAAKWADELTIPCSRYHANGLDSLLKVLDFQAALLCDRVRELIRARNEAILAHEGIKKALYVISNNDHAEFASRLPHVKATRVIL